MTLDKIKSMLAMKNIKNYVLKSRQMKSQQKQDQLIFCLEKSSHQFSLSKVNVMLFDVMLLPKMGDATTEVLTWVKYGTI